jgi:glycerophosphoryl diester phosphodiesterase
MYYDSSGGVVESRSACSPLIIAHRGHNADLPEQTMLAFEAAIRLGADMIEADAQLSCDGKLVLLHDLTLDRTTSGTGPAAQLTVQELRQLDAGSWFADRFAGQPIPVLHELIDLADESGIALCLEAKAASRADQLRVALALGETIASAGRLDIDYLASFDHAALRAAADATPGLRTAPDRLPERGPAPVSDLVRQAARARAQVIQHHHADLNGNVVDGLHRAGLAVWAWPANHPEEIHRALSLGVDAVMSDDIGAAATAVSVYAATPAGAG